MAEIDPNKAIDEIFRMSSDYAKAKAERVYLEQFRKSQKAILVLDAKGTVQERESYAYAHKEYQTTLNGLREAVEIEETLRWQLVAAQARVEVWRTNSANNRALDNSTR